MMRRWGLGSGCTMKETASQEFQGQHNTLVGKKVRHQQIDWISAACEEFSMGKHTAVCASGDASLGSQHLISLSSSIILAT